MSRPTNLRVAVVGLGYWGPNLVRNLHEVPETEVCVVCDVRPESLERIARRFPAVETTTSYQRILDDESIAAVAIATPVATHTRLAERALLARKHVFVEKAARFIARRFSALASPGRCT